MSFDKRWIPTGLLAWFLMLGVDFLLHGGLLAGLYTRESAFLLPLETAFARIPIGYAAFALLTVALVWLQVRMRIVGWRAGFVFGLEFGLLVWGALILGLWSIATAEPDVLVSWWLGQAFELALGGGVVGVGLQGGRLRRLTGWVIGAVVGLIVLTIVLQNVVTSN